MLTIQPIDAIANLARMALTFKINHDTILQSMEGGAEKNSKQKESFKQ